MILIMLMVDMDTCRLQVNGMWCSCWFWGCCDVPASQDDCGKAFAFVVMLFEIIVVVFFLQMVWIIQRGQSLAKRIVGNAIFFANALEYPDGPASSKGDNWTQHFFANALDHPDGPASCKEDYWKQHFFANALDHLDGSASCKEDNRKQYFLCKCFGSSEWVSLLQRE